MTNDLRSQAPNLSIPSHKCLCNESFLSVARGVECLPARALFPPDIYFVGPREGRSDSSVGKWIVVHAQSLHVWCIDPFQQDCFYK